MRIDAHHHMWAFDPVEYDWIDDSMSVLKQDYLLKELEHTLSKNGFEGSIAVQARQSIEETLWLSDIAESTDLIKGVVGWIDIRSDSLSNELKQLKNHKKIVGFRHVIQGETDPTFMRNPDFIRGLKILAEHNYTYDLLIFAHQLPAAAKMLAQVPNLNVVIDHIAKPKIKTKAEFEQWQRGMAELAKNQNCYCKLSGMVTEADWDNWSQNDFESYLDTVFDLFGTERLMFGSDWPVCLVAGQYEAIKNIVLAYIQDRYPDSIDNIFGDNASRFYQI